MSTNFNCHFNCMALWGGVKIWEKSLIAKRVYCALGEREKETENDESDVTIIVLKLVMTSRSAFHQIRTFRFGHHTPLPLLRTSLSFFLSQIMNIVVNY